MDHFRYRPELLEGMPDDILRCMKQFEDWFTIDADQLKKITNHFVQELEKGLTVEGGSIVSDSPRTKPRNVTDSQIAHDCQLDHGLPDRPRERADPHHRHGWHQPPRVRCVSG